MIDFMLHSSCSFVILIALCFKYRTEIHPIMLTLLIGILKELFDLFIQKESFSLLDILYDIVGISIAWLVLYVLTKYGFLYRYRLI